MASEHPLALLQEGLCFNSLLPLADEAHREMKPHRTPDSKMAKQWGRGLLGLSRMKKSLFCSERCLESLCQLLPLYWEDTS